MIAYTKSSSRNLPDNLVWVSSESKPVVVKAQQPD